jgi:non-ribosomal peptide synthetase component E (peptide arylation enzyme)
MGFLSFKTELVWRNPDELLGVAAWADPLLAGLLAGNAARIPDHLAVTAAAQRHRPTAMSRYFHQNASNLTKIASANSVNSH